MKAIEKAFGIKKLFSRALSDNRPWKEKIKVVNGKYTCIKVQVQIKVDGPTKKEKKWYLSRKDRPLTPLTLRFRNKLGTSQSVVNHMELNWGVNITWKGNVRKIWQFMFAGYADFLQKNKVHVPYLETQPTHF